MKRGEYLGGVAAGGFAFSVMGRRAAAQATAIRVGSTPVEGNAQPYYAADMAFFEKAGLHPEVTVLQSGPALAAAVVGGTLDIGASSPLVFMNAIRHGVPLTVVAAGALYASSAATTLLVVAPPSPVRTAKDLNGKTIAGISVGAMDQLAIMSWMDANGGDSSSIKVVEVPPSGMADALEQGRIAAALLPDPQLTAAGNRVRSIGKAYDAIAPTFMAGVWYSTTDFAAKNAVAVRQFGVAMAQAGAWAEANPERAAAILEKWTKTKVERIRTHYTTRRADTASLIQPICDRAYKYKLIDEPMDAKAFLWQSKT